jgi:uncharacterized phage protein (TIGR01671 family)
MRDLKFRVWITPWGNAEPTSEMVYIQDGELGSYFGNWERGGYKDAVFQQYTGLKDKTGKEIYEGDIVRYVEKMDQHGDSQVLTATVIYDNDYGAWGLGKKEVHNYFLDFTVLKNTVEVLGNIFENKDLLK